MYKDGLSDKVIVHTWMALASQSWIHAALGHIIVRHCIIHIYMKRYANGQEKKAPLYYLCCN